MEGGRGGGGGGVLLSCQPADGIYGGSSHDTPATSGDIKLMEEEEEEEEEEEVKVSAVVFCLFPNLTIINKE